MPTPSTLLPPATSTTRRVAGRILRSRIGDVLDSLVGPHGLDRYLELVDPLLARDVDRAVVTDVRRETPDTTTLTLRPNRWDGHLPGQWVEIAVEVDGRRQVRCYSISSSPHRGDGQFTITVKADPGGLVSPHLAHRIGRGSVVEISAAQGEFVLPAPRPDRVLLISGGSGVTPVTSMLRALADEDADTGVTWLHYARTARDVAFADELRDLHGRRRNVRVVTVLTRDPEGSDLGLRGHLDQSHLDALGDLAGVPAWVCGPASLIEAATDLWARRGESHLLHVERFQLAPLETDPDAAGGTVTFADSHVVVDSDGTTLLDQAEAAGLQPQYGCRMGICHTCVRPKLAGRVRDVRDGRISSCDPEKIQLCISAPVGDVTVDL